MSNRFRLQTIGAAYHVNIKAVTGVRAFPDTYHRERFLLHLAAEVEKSNWRCLAYTILGTHFHVIVELRELTLSSGFQRLNSSYSRWFNRKHGRTGALWQARFYDVLIESDFQLLEAYRYVAQNAPRAGLVENPEDWAFCSYGASVGRFPKEPFVDDDAILRLLGADRRQACARLRAYVDETDPRRRRQSFVRAKTEQAQTPAVAPKRVNRTARATSRKPIDS